GIGAGRVGQRYFEIVRNLRACSSRSYRFNTWGDEFSGVVFYRGISQVISFGVNQFNIADGPRSLLHLSGNSIIAFAAHARRPFYGRSLAHLGVPLGANFGEVVGKYRGRAATISAVDGSDREVWEFRLFVERDNLGIVPFFDLAEINTGDYFWR